MAAWAGSMRSATAEMGAMSSSVGGIDIERPSMPGASTSHSAGSDGVGEAGGAADEAGVAGFAVAVMVGVGMGDVVGAAGRDKRPAGEQPTSAASQHNSGMVMNRL